MNIEKRDGEVFFVNESCGDTNPYTVKLTVYLKLERRELHFRMTKSCYPRVAYVLNKNCSYQDVRDILLLAEEAERLCNPYCESFPPVNAGEKTYGLSEELLKLNITVY